jgi:hypothetical protein
MNYEKNPEEDLYVHMLTAVQDRRPITPPPCVRLIITDVNTGKECDCK